MGRRGASVSVGDPGSRAITTGRNGGLQYTSQARTQSGVSWFEAAVALVAGRAAGWFEAVLRDGTGRTRVDTTLGPRVEGGQGIPRHRGPQAARTIRGRFDRAGLSSAVQEQREVLHLLQPAVSQAQCPERDAGERVGPGQGRPRDGARAAGDSETLLEPQRGLPAVWPGWLPLCGGGRRRAERRPAQLRPEPACDLREDFAHRR